MTWQISSIGRRSLLAIGVASALRAHDETDDPPAITRTALVHGMAGPFAVAGYRMGTAALLKLQLRRGSMDLDVTHYSPPEVQWSCVIDGLQAATGASLGKMNLHRVDSKETYSVVKNKKTGQTLRFDLAESLIQSNLNLPYDKLQAAGQKVAKLKDADVFRVR
jgi:formylmethanofuran dehydrogenase subunit E